MTVVLDGVQFSRRIFLIHICRLSLLFGKEWKVTPVGLFVVELKQLNAQQQPILEIISVVQLFFSLLFNAYLLF